MSKQKKKSEDEGRIIGKKTGWGYVDLGDGVYRVPGCLDDDMNEAMVEELALDHLLKTILTFVTDRQAKTKKMHSRFWNTVGEDLSLPSGFSYVYDHRTRSVQPVPNPKAGK